MKDYEKRGYLLENFRLFHLQSQGAAKVDFHYHEFCKLLLLVSGQGSYYIEGQHYLLQSGDVVMVGSHCIHKPEMEDSTLYERIIVYVSPDYLRQLSTPECDLLSVFSGERGHVLRLPDSQSRQLFRLAVQLERDLAQEGFGREQLSSAGLVRLLVALGRNLERRGDSQPGLLMPESRRNYEIMRYIDAHLEEDLDMEQLAKRFYVSKYYMMHSFRRETGFTVYGYLTQRRLIQARAYMDAGMSATESCYRCGFGSYSSFTRAYGKYYGTTPTGRTEGKMVRAADYE